MSELITLFINSLEAKGLSQSFIKSSRHRLMVFHEFCLARGESRLPDITKSLMQDYQDYVSRLKTNGRSLSLPVQQKYMRAVDKFFTWATQENHMLFNPMSGLARPKLTKSLPKDILTEREVFRLLEAIEPNNPARLRNKTVLELLYATGIRKQELIDLDVCDMNIEEQEVMIIDGKGLRDRVLPLSNRASHWLKLYFQKARPIFEIIHRGSKALFLGEKTERLSRNTVQAFFKRALKKAGINKPGSCHILRHSMATHMLERGSDIRYIQRILGHKDLASTEIYTRVGIVKLKEVHAKTHPAAGFGGLR